jgi:hypothetical protein
MQIVRVLFIVLDLFISEMQMMYQLIIHSAYILVMMSQQHTQYIVNQVRGLIRIQI